MPKAAMKMIIIIIWCWCLLFLLSSTLLFISMMPLSSSSFAVVAFTISSSSSSTRHHHRHHLNNNQFNHQHQQGLVHRNNKNVVSLQVSSSSDSTSNNNNINNNHLLLEFTSALCIIPPIWDRIQRARHYARDSLFHTWPPCIRLFHPFSSSQGTSFDVAQAIEELEIEPFDVTFNNQWVIIPHYESIQQELFTTHKEQLPPIEDHYNIQKNYEESSEDKEVRLLIESEEQKAKIAYQKRVEKKLLKEQLKKRKKQQQQQQAAAEGGTQEEEEDDIDIDNDNEDDCHFGYEVYRKMSPPSEIELSPYEMYQSQQQFYEEDGGPCILCLEPDEESATKLKELRESLQEFLNTEPNYFSPSSCYNFDSSTSSSANNAGGGLLTKQLIHPELYDMGYRPLLPIGGVFESFPIAMETARRLKGLWGDDNPLTFTVNELHVISCFEDEEADSTTWNDEFGGGSGGGDVSGGGDGGDNELFMIQRQQPEKQYSSIPWGCNAKIMLFGQEIEQDDEFNQQQVNMLVEEGIAGGMDLSNDITILQDEEEEPTSGIEAWLNDDDDYDEGLQLMIGRTTFYTGDQRNLKQMPVSSVVDHKDLALGENVQKVSAVARRRRTSSRQTNAFEDGEYGRRDIDYLPWTKHQRSRLKRNPKNLGGLWKDADEYNNSDDDEANSLLKD